MLVALMLAAGCGSQADFANWSAAVDVQGNNALVTVTVPGAQLGKDYHPHLRLNDGPEMMQYAPIHTFRNLRPGTYTLTVHITDSDHKPIAGVKDKTLTFVIK